MNQRGGICDTRCQTFWTSVIENEETMRKKWFIKNQDRLLENLQLEESKLWQKIRDDLKPSPEKSQSCKKSLEKKEKLGKINKIEPSKPKRKNFTEFIFMKPIDLKVKEILYEHGVESFTAARNYLRERYKQKPVERFYYRECSSWEHGWRLKDSPPIPLSQVGIRSIMETSFYSRDASSLTRDPDWYRMFQTKNAKNFNEILTY